MPPRTVPYDLKLRIPVLRHVHSYSVNKICEVLGIRNPLYTKLFTSMLHSPMLPVPIHAQQAVVAVSITRTSITSNHTAICTALHS